MATNITCDVFRFGKQPPGDEPAVKGAKGFLRAAVERGLEHTEGLTALAYTHILDVDVDVDIRDNAAGFGSGGDDVYVPDEDGTRFNVTGVVRVGYNTGSDMRRVYLYRRQTPYPTTFL